MLTEKCGGGAIEDDRLVAAARRAVVVGHDGGIHVLAAVKSREIVLDDVAVVVFPDERRRCPEAVDFREQIGLEPRGLQLGVVEILVAHCVEARLQRVERAIERSSAQAHKVDAFEAVLLREPVPQVLEMPRVGQ